MTWISCRIHFTVTRDGKPGSANDAHRVASQVHQDALFGTFAEIDEDAWQDKLAQRPDELSSLSFNDAPIDRNSGRFEFTLRLASDLFPPELGGAVHLFSMLSGDLLRFVLPPLLVKDFEVRELTFPDEWKQQHRAVFRATAHTVEEIRKGFALEAGMPLLAFSFKPRVGFRLDALEDIAFQVLNAGFNIVEVDTRYIPQTREHLDALKSIAVRLADKVGGTGRLSLNFTLPTPIALEEIEKLCQQLPPPVVVKIDGALNGIDLIQSVRRAKMKDMHNGTPFITCYPLMRAALQPYVPPDEVLDALIASGADIIYPGGRPDIGGMLRSLDGTSEKSFVSAVERYRRLTTNGDGMPTIAGGIYAGQLHAYYELLGPNVPWFLGGGVALHKDGPAAGAKLCVEIAKESAQLRAKNGKEWSDGLKLSIVKSCNEAYTGRSALAERELRYFLPRESFKTIPIRPIEI